ncbi:XPG I-region-domain-containing protein [Colletotrichum phormii]|uniref:XPG I-region-domain-containing protein n=1 Tax=Colletotrichum phormii TaxID=359342 RepID=A0AAI9ZYN6_9PEZI|nr:XPG I-region-domain-containing protein [Colletotrichum phormii]KAK1640618.1 XPG I-region-domain-containing protein [Colletotrichum phormii]
MLDHLGVPWHKAPGEAEAECAKLQQEGLVDAVWSEDGDAFMFGCRVLIKNLKGPPGKPKCKEHAKRFNMGTICGLKKGLNNEKPITLFAMLIGLDYVPEGLRGCGMVLAQKLVKDGALAEDSNFKNFPDLQALRYCRWPVVSDEATLEALPFLQGEWYGTHTTESLTTMIPWLQHYFYSQWTTIRWISKFVPIEVTQKLLRREAGARGLLIAKVTQKRKERPTTSVQLDPFTVFPGIESVFIESENNFLLNRLPIDHKLAGQAIENENFELLDAILGLGMEDSEFQAWNKKKMNARVATMVHPPISRAQAPLMKRTSAREPRDNSHVGQDPSPLASRRPKGFTSNLLVHKKTTPTTASPSGRSPLSKITMNASPASPTASFGKKELGSFDVGQSSKDIPENAQSRSSGLRHGSIHNPDDENIHEESVSAKKRKLEEPVAENVQAEETPGARARRTILEIESYSSQDSVPATKAKGQKKRKSAVGESLKGAAEKRKSGGGTTEDPFVV